MVSVRRLLSRFGFGGTGVEPLPTPDLPLDLLDPAFLRDPYAVYAQLRRDDPVHRTRSGAWLLTRHVDVLKALSDLALGNAPSARAAVSARNRGRYVSADVAANILPFLDNPEHTVPRKIIAAAFRGHLKECAPDVAALASGLLRPLVAAGRMEVMRDFGKPLSVAVISRLLGLPESDRDALVRHSDGFFRLFAPMPSEQVRQDADRELAAFRSYFAPLVTERRARPDDGLISRLIAGEAEGRRLTDIEIVDACMLLFADGVENVDAAIANALLALSRHADERRRLYAAPGLVPAAVGEALRFDSPAQSIARIARSDMEIGGRQVRRDGVVLLALASANRDPDVFARPDVFDMSRATDALLTFGKGRHGCIGAPLVRLQMQGALRAMIGAGVVAEVDASHLEWMPRVGHRWLKALPVRFARAD